MTYKEKIYSAETGETTWRDLTADEIKIVETGIAEAKIHSKAEANKVAAKQSAQAKLAALGLTEEEVASILG